jgi:hypothetical protein
MEENCSICLEKTNHTLECKHFNCINCLKRHMKKSNLCPVCRQTFNTNPYKYIPPRHTPNLKINKKTKQFFNKYLNSRYFLANNKYQRWYAGLMSCYHEYIYVNGKYINQQVLTSMNKYDVLQLYLIFKDKKCIFHSQVKMEMMYAIEMILCNPTNYELVGTLLFSSFP